MNGSLLCNRSCNLTHVEASEATDALANAIDIMWVLLCAFLVVSMQLGFAMLEVGCCREAHRMTVLAKNVLDSAVSCVGFSGVGVQICSSVLRSSAHGAGGPTYHLMMFFWGMGATSVTVCSGSMAERAHMFSYLCYALLMSSVIFPVLAESAWGTDGAYLYGAFHNVFGRGHDYHDFAGSGVVHLIGGVAALSGNTLLGRRVFKPKKEQDMSLTGRERFGDLESQGSQLASDLDGVWTRRFDDQERDKAELQGCNYLQAMGMFSLWVGWYGFNTGFAFQGSQAGASLAGTVAWNTTLSAAGGGIGTFTFCYCVQEVLDVGFICNGIIAGLVAITASCDVATSGMSLGIGLVVGAIVFPLSSYAVKFFRLDDPVDAIPVHFASGLFGVLVVGLCKPDCSSSMLVDGRRSPKQDQLRFCVASHSMGSQLIAQSCGALVLICYTGAACFLLFGIFAVSEYALAVEAEHLDNALQLLQKPVDSEELQKKVHEEWLTLVTKSYAVKAVLVQHGWTDDRIKEVTPEAACELKCALADIRGRRFETALEGRDVRYHPCAFLGRVVGRTWFVRRLAIARLRISPYSEVSGLEANVIDMSVGLRTIKSAVKVFQSEHAAESERKTAEMVSRMQELTAIVSSQDTLLQKLATRQRGTPHRSRIGSPAHLLSPAGSGSQRSLEEVPETGIRLDLQIGPGERQEVFQGTSIASSGDSTVSDRSCGAITPHSQLSSTPPPTIFGARKHARSRDALPAGAINDLANAAMQIARALESQQHLLSRLQREPRSTSSQSECSSRTGSDPDPGRLRLQIAASPSEPPRAASEPPRASSEPPRGPSEPPRGSSDPPRV